MSGALAALKELGLTGEVVLVDDGSSDGTREVVKEFATENPGAPIRLIAHMEPSGLSAALTTGLSEVRGELVCLLPADLESLPQDDIPLLFRALDSQTDIVCGRRVRRGDGKDASSRIYAGWNRLLFGVRVYDGNWIKLIRREKLAGLQIYPDWHRFLLALLTPRGCRIKEVDTQWNRRQYGRSNYGVSRIPAGVAGSLAVKAYLGFRGRPLLFFFWVAIWLGVIATVLALIGVAGSHYSKIWIPAWVMSGCFLTVGGVSVLFGLAAEFARWDRGPPTLAPRRSASTDAS